MKYFVKFRYKSSDPAKMYIYSRGGTYEDLDTLVNDLKISLDAGVVRSGDTILIDLAEKRKEDSNGET